MSLCTGDHMYTFNCDVFSVKGDCNKAKRCVTYRIMSRLFKIGGFSNKPPIRGVPTKLTLKLLGPPDGQDLGHKVVRIKHLSLARYTHCKVSQTAVQVPVAMTFDEKTAVDLRNLHAESKEKAERQCM